MTADWKPLRHILAEYRARKTSLDFWWRDDDATQPTTGLDKLEALSTRMGMQVHIAVIPKLAEQSLAHRVADSKMLVPLVHGWQHISHAPFGEKKAEFGRQRPKGAAEIHHAVKHMRRLFAEKFTPVFVPPWNRIDEVYLPDLHEAGIKILSTFTPRTDTEAKHGIVQINTHIDPIDWKGSRDLVAPQELLSGLVALLEKRLSGDADKTEPLGYLTHHLVHSPATWLFSERLIQELLDGGAKPVSLAAVGEAPA